MRKLLSLLFLGSLATFGQLAVTPSAATVKQGASLAFTANRSVTWSLTPGSAGSISPQGVYTAPISIPVKQSTGGCQLLPPDHIYNTRIDTLPVHPNSAALLARLPTLGLGFSPSFGQNIITNATPSQNLTFLYTPLNNGTYQIPVWPNLKRETGVFTPSLAGFDRHVISVNRENCTFTDLYDNYPAGTNTIQNCPECTGQSGVKYDNSFALPVNGATDAAGMAQQPLSLRLSDITSGEIKHALRFTLANYLIEPNFIWPATANAYPYCTPGDTCFHYGMYLRLKSSFNTGGFSPIAKMILTALQRYGMILADGGTTMDVQTDTDLMMNPAVRQALKEIGLASIQPPNFEVVNTSPLLRDIKSGDVALNNGYVTPTQFTEVVATASSGEQAKVRIALQGITVGVPEPAITIMSGHEVQLTAWVSGTSNQTVNWRIEPGIGSIASNGLYRTPSGLTAPATLRATASSVVDATAMAFVDITVWPSNDNGAIRIDVGSSRDYTDAQGHKWYRESYSVFESGSLYLADDPGVFPSGTPDYFFNANKHYADSVYRWYVPNGNYKVTLFMSLGESTGQIPDYRSHLESQGQIAKYRVSLNAVTGGLYRRGGAVSIPMEVTSGSGYFAHRQIGEGFPVLSAIEVVPDSTPPHLEIDAPTGTFPAGSTVQLRAVGWYMPAGATWQRLSGPGSIDANGLFTVPAGASSPTIIRTSSTADPSKIATAVIQYTGASASICAFALPDAKPNTTVPYAGGTVSVSIQSSTPGCSLTTATVSTSGAISSYTMDQGTLKAVIAPNNDPAARIGQITIAGQTLFLTQAGRPLNPGLVFVPINPCRLMDTRAGGGKSGLLGPPRIEAQGLREIPVLSASCGIPSSAQAYAITVTAVPAGPLAFLSLYPWGQPTPVASTLNSFNGRVIANSTILPAGVNGSLALFASNPTDVIIDITGYFVSPTDSSGLVFYPISPCRIADTRANSGKAGSYGFPALAGGQSRSFDLVQSGCGVPANAQAYAVNITALPVRTLGYMTAYPTGSERPLSSVLNAWEGQVVAASTLVRSGAGGVTLFATDDTHVILDVYGYFAAPGSAGGLYYYSLSPCRIADTRSGAPFSSQSTRTFPVTNSGCGIPSSAKALAANVTVVPVQPLSFLTVWPSGSPRPLVSLLNSWTGDVVANFSIAGLGSDVATNVFASDPTHVVIDSLGYFGQ